MMHKSVAGEFLKEVDSTTVLLDDILSILALLEAGDWSEHCTKTELGGRLEKRDYDLLVMRRKLQSLVMS